MMVGLWNEDADEGGYMVGGLPPLLLAPSLLLLSQAPSK